jgi:[protein-PII] uridylyltransferase
MAKPLEPNDVRAHALPTEPGTYEYTVVAHDRPGLFSKVSGAMALNGVNIVAAQGYTRADGLALEVFRCIGEFERKIGPERWERIAEDIRKALKGKLSLELRLAERQEAYGRGVAKGNGKPPKVIVDNATSDFLTVVEVHAADRIGLLYDITSVFADLGLDIQVAKIATYGEDVVDVFYVRDLVGQKITDPEHLAEIERTLRRRLAAMHGS